MSEPKKRRAALLELIQSFKQPEDSDIDAALNVIVNHAKEIDRLRERVVELEEKAGWAASRSSFRALPLEGDDA